MVNHNNNYFLIFGRQIIGFWDFKNLSIFWRASKPVFYLLFTILYREIRKRQVQQTFINHSGEELAGNGDEENLKHEIATKHILIIMVCSFVFWMPYWISRISTSVITSNQIMSDKSLHYLTYLPMYLAYREQINFWKKKHKQFYLDRTQ